jgi:type 1 fimbria pilin
MKHITIGKKAIRLWVILIICFMVGVVVAITAFGIIQISYRVVPSTQAPILSPNPISVSLGDIVSGSTGSNDFGKVGTMSLPTGYSITAELDTSTIQNHFSSFYLYIDVYKGGSYVGDFYLSLTWTSDSLTLDSGNYDLYLKVYYTAKSVSSTVSGTATITFKYPE